MLVEENNDMRDLTVSGRDIATLIPIPAHGTQIYVQSQIQRLPCYTKVVNTWISDQTVKVLRRRCFC